MTYAEIIFDAYNKGKDVKHKEENAVVVQNDKGIFFMTKTLDAELVNDNLNHFTIDGKPVSTETKVDQAFKRFHNLVCDVFGKLNDEEYTEFMTRVKAAALDELQAPK
jgi:hypothetical protein